jgi:hypothetical protein
MPLCNDNNNNQIKSNQIKSKMVSNRLILSIITLLCAVGFSGYYGYCCYDNNKTNYTMLKPFNQEDTHQNWNHFDIQNSHNIYIYFNDTKKGLTFESSHVLTHLNDAFTKRNVHDNWVGTNIAFSYTFTNETVTNATKWIFGKTLLGSLNATERLVNDVVHSSYGELYVVDGKYTFDFVIPGEPCECPALFPFESTIFTNGTCHNLNFNDSFRTCNGEIYYTLTAATPLNNRQTLFLAKNNVCHYNDTNFRHDNHVGSDIILLETTTFPNTYRRKNGAIITADFKSEEYNTTTLSTFGHNTWNTAVVVNDGYVYIFGSKEFLNDFDLNANYGVTLSRVELALAEDNNFKQFEYFTGNNTNIFNGNTSYEAVPLEGLVFDFPINDTTVIWNEYLYEWCLIFVDSKAMTVNIATSRYLQGPWRSGPVYNVPAPFNDHFLYELGSVKIYPELSSHSHEIVYAYIPVSKHNDLNNLSYFPKFVKLDLRTATGPIVFL